LACCQLSWRRTCQDNIWDWVIRVTSLAVQSCTVPSRSSTVASCAHLARPRLSLHRPATPPPASCEIPEAYASAQSPFRLSQEHKPLDEKLGIRGVQSTWNSVSHKRHQCRRSCVFLAFDSTKCLNLRAVMSDEIERRRVSLKSLARDK